MINDKPSLDDIGDPSAEHLGTALQGDPKASESLLLIKDRGLGDSLFEGDLLLRMLWIIREVIPLWRWFIMALFLPGDCALGVE